MQGWLVDSIDIFTTIFVLIENIYDLIFEKNMFLYDAMLSVLGNTSRLQRS